MISKIGNFKDPLLDRQIEEIIYHMKHPVIPEGGIVLRTPDGTKLYKIAIDNAGAVTTADVTSDFA